MKEVNLENFTKATPLVLGFFILCGSFYLSIYFDCFHINIFNYLDTTEILTAFLYLIHDIVFVFAFSLIYLIIMKFIFRIIDMIMDRRKNNTFTEENIPKAEQVFFKSFESSSMLILVISAAFNMIYIICSYGINTSSFLVKNEKPLGYCLIVFSFIAAVLIIKQFESSAKNGLRDLIIFFALFFISYSINKAVERVSITNENAKYTTTIFLETKDKKDSIVSNLNYIYVGRTNKYIFFYDLNKKKADVIPQDKVSKVSFTDP